MEPNVMKSAEKYSSRRKHRKRWQKVVACLGAVVVFCTTYALILPAITMETQYICGLEEHVHDDSCYQLAEPTAVETEICSTDTLGVHTHAESCYDVQGKLICGTADFVLHTHSTICYDESGALRCLLPEVEAHTHDESCWQHPHIHEEACYIIQQDELLCALTEGSTHTHTDACMEQTQELVCELPETAAHLHEDACYAETMVQICQLEESDGHTHDDACYVDTKISVCTLSEADGHTHAETCFEIIRTLNCETPEGEGHTHTESCFETSLQLICETEETEGHTHSELCYQTVDVVSCGIEANVPHVHSNDCYAQTQQLNCDQLTAEDGAQAVLICEKEELTPHIHIAACQDEQGAFTCGLLALEQHVHDSDCFDVTSELQLVCEQTEHTHIDTCKASEEVSAETLVYTCYIDEHTHDELCCDESGTLICTLTEHTHDDTCLSETSSETCTLEEHIHDELCVDENGILTCTLTEHSHDEICGGLSSGIALMSLIPSTVIASGTEPNAEGVADAITWTLTEDSSGVRTLTFSGSGAMKSYTTNGAPWMAYKDYNTHLVFEEGITRIGPYSFANNFQILSIDFGPTVTSIGEGAFVHSETLATLVIPGTVTTIEKSAFIYSHQLHTVILEEGVATVGSHAFGSNNATTVTVEIPASLTSIGYKAFWRAKEYVVAEGNPNYCTVDGVLYSKDMTVLVDYPRNKAATEYRVPDTVTTIGSGALCSVISTDKLYVPGTVKTVTGRLADSSAFKEIHLENGFTPVDENGNATGMGLWFYLTQGNLKVLTLPEDTSYTLGQIFYNGGTFQLERFTYPKGVTKINRVSNSNGVPYFPYLQEVRYDAQEASLHTVSPYSDILGENTTFPLVIGPNVDVLDETFYLLSDYATEFTFEGVNYITAEAGSFTKAPSPLAGLSGELYVDGQGAVYRYDAAAMTAELVYVSPGTQTLTVPATIPASDGTPCTVITVKQDAFAAATVTSLTIEAPQSIITVETNAFANCETLTSVNGETTEAGATGLFTGAALGYKPFYNTGLESSVPENGYTDGTPGVKELTVSSTGATDMIISLSSQAKTIQWEPSGTDETTGTWKLLTGDNLLVNIAAGNDTATAQHTYRVYFRYEEGCEMNFEPGNTYTFDGQSVTCHGTEDPNTVYLEFTPPVGNTAAFSVTALYPSPNSDGGHVTIWGKVVTDGTANIEPTPGATLEADWNSKPDSFSLTKKTMSEALMAVWADETGTLRPSATLNWEITMTRVEEAVSAYGKDYVTSVDVVDTMVLPAGVSWDPAVLEAIKAGSIRRSGTTLYLNETQIVAATNAVSSSVQLVWNESAQAVELHYRLVNLSNEAEITLPKVTVNFHPAAFVVDGGLLASDAKVENRVQATLHYNYSDDLILESSDDRPIGLQDGSLSLTKKSSAGSISYFGEDVTYTITIKNNGASAWTTTDAPLYLLDTLPSQTYIKLENMERMFQEDNGLIIVIRNASLKQAASVTDAYGAAGGALVTSGNSGSPDDGTNGNLVVLRYDGTNYTAVIYRPGVTQPTNDQLAKGEAATPSETVSADSISTLLQQIGYDLTAQETCACIWYPADTVTDENGTSTIAVSPGVAITRQVYATFRDTFHLLQVDWPNSYDSTGTGQIKSVNSVSLKDTAKHHNSASTTNTILREAYVDKTVFRDGQELLDGFTVGDKNVLDYQLHFEHYGNSTSKNLPMVDDLYGSQYLLVPVAGNDHLAGLNTYTDDGVNYYILTEGTYTDVKVGVDETGAVLTAASVTVARATGKTEVDLSGNIMTYTGLHTEIKWYFPEISGNWYTTVRYKALTDLSIQDNGTYTIGNAVWMNDREGSRIYDFIWGGGTLIKFEKHIVTQRGAAPTEDVLAEHSLIEQGQVVTYRLTLTNINDYPFTLTGDKLADALPNSFGKFAWEKGINITDFEVVLGEGDITYNGLENWYIGESYSGLLGRDQFILWPEETSIQFNDASTLYLYFTLTFPDDAAAWGSYLDVVSGSLIDNTLYVYHFSSTVTHNLKESGQILLQKGVSGSYYFWKDQNNKYTPIGSSRFYYSSETSRDRAVLYYVILYNGDNKRLYLDTLTDTLPKGFTFESLHDDGDLSDMTGKISHMSIQTVAGTVANGVTTHPLIEDGLGNISFRTATVSATVTTEYNSQNDPPNEVVEFQITSPSSITATNPVKYDEELGLYYLDRDEAIVFGVIAQVGTSYQTGDAPATNTVSMPYLDYLGTGVEVIPATELPIRATSDQVFPDYNDGDRQLLPDGTGQMLQSQVTMYAGEVIPGVTKITDSYTTSDGNTHPYVHSAYYDATIHWRVLLHNSGAKQMQLYSFVDVLPKPYVFTGDVSVSIHDADGNVMRVEEVILTFPDRTERTGTETELVIQRPSNSSGTQAGTKGPVTMPYTELYPGTPLYTAPGIYMNLFRDESGNEGMMLHFTSYGMAIPEGGYVEIELSAVNPTGDYRAAVFTNQATLVPISDTFSSVGHGSLTDHSIKLEIPMRDENGNYVKDENNDYVMVPYELSYPAVTNTAPVAVNLGIATSSEKQVTEKADPTNTATSVDLNNNSIVLKNRDSTFTYTLLVENVSETTMSKLVLIDNLPEEGDHSPFHDYIQRNSQFTVNLAPDPNFTVSIVSPDGTEVKTLTSDQYTIQYATTTDFGGPQSNDWKGLNTNTTANWTTVSTGARAFRLIIEDPTPTDADDLMPANCTIKVTFDAELEDNTITDVASSVERDALPGEIAWNSFGYHYKLKSSNTELEAMPLTVGVKIPTVPTLKKELVDASGLPFSVTEDTVFHFLLHEGTALTETYDTAEALKAALDTADIPYREIAVTVPKNRSVSDALPLELNDWTWEIGQTYTLLELPVDYPYTFLRFNGTNETFHTFTYAPDQNQIFTCINLLEQWSVELTKTGATADELLPGAVFALYSPEPVDFTVPDTFTALNVQTQFQQGGNIWYLAGIAETGDDGKLSFPSLTQEYYYLLEVKAPDGYNPLSSGLLLQRLGTSGGVYHHTVVNYPTYELPETGGAGTYSYTIGGLLLIAATGLFLLYNKTRRKEDFSSP